MSTATHYTEEVLTSKFDRLDIHEAILKAGFKNFSDEYVEGSESLERVYTREVSNLKTTVTISFQEEGEEYKISIPVLDIRAILIRKEDIAPEGEAVISLLYPDQFKNVEKYIQWVEATVLSMPFPENVR